MGMSLSVLGVSPTVGHLTLRSPPQRCHLVGQPTRPSARLVSSLSLRPLARLCHTVALAHLAAHLPHRLALSLSVLQSPLSVHRIRRGSMESYSTVPVSLLLFLSPLMTLPGLFRLALLFLSSCLLLPSLPSLRWGPSLTRRSEACPSSCLRPPFLPFFPLLPCKGRTAGPLHQPSPLLFVMAALIQRSPLQLCSPAVRLPTGLLPLSHPTRSSVLPVRCASKSLTMGMELPC